MRKMILFLIATSFAFTALAAESQEDSRNDLQSEETKILDEGVFKVDMLPSSGTDVQSLDVFGIALNTSIQEVINVLEAKNIEFTGLRDDESHQQRCALLRDTVKRRYENSGITDARKESALKIIDEGKIKLFPVKYQSKQYWLSPVSLDMLLQADRMTPVFDELYEKYNSQFCVSYHLNLPEDMKSQGIAGFTILFGSINQDEPRSFLVSLDFNGRSANPKLCAILNKKYGLPKFHYTTPHYTPYEEPNYSSEFNRAFDYLKKEAKSFEEHKKDDVICKTILQYLTTDQALDTISLPFKLTSRHKELAWFILEWDCGDFKILGDFVLVADEKCLVIRPVVINYLYYPLALKATEAVADVLKASRDVGSKVAEKSAGGF